MLPPVYSVYRVYRKTRVVVRAYARACARPRARTHEGCLLEVNRVNGVNKIRKLFISNGLRCLPSAGLFVYWCRVGKRIAAKPFFHACVGSDGTGLGVVGTASDEQ